MIDFGYPIQSSITLVKGTFESFLGDFVAEAEALILFDLDTDLELTLSHEEKAI